MLQRGNSDAAKRLRKTKAGREPAPREKIFIPTDPAQLHDQAVVAAVRAHEIAYGPAKTSMDDDRASRGNRPSLERQGSHIARHLSNASSKNKTSRPKPVRKTTKTLSEDSNHSRFAISTPAISEAQHNTFRSVDERRHRTQSPVTNSPSAAPSRNRLREQTSNIPPQTSESAALYDTSMHIFDALPSTPSQLSIEPAKRDQSGNPPSESADPMEHLLSQTKYQQELRYTPSISNLSFISRLSRSKQRQQPEEAYEQEARPSATAPKAKSIWKSTKGNTLKKTRTVSVSFTNTIKKAFGKRSPSPIVELPPQQVQAHRPHYGSESTTASRHISISSLHLDAEEEYERAHSRSQTPALGATMSRGGSRQQSSGASDDSLNTRSRVTSWMTSSSKENTMRIYREPQLPQIEESPAHFPVTSADHLQESPTVSLRAEPLRSDHNKVDGRRLLSAIRTHMAGKPHQPGSDTRDISGSTTNSWQSTRMTDRSVSEDVDEPVNMSANITDFNSDFPFGVLTEPQIYRESMVSPSVYSARPAENHSQDTLAQHEGSNGATPRGGPSPALERAMSPAGTAYISESHQVSKWSLPISSSPAKPVPNTSGEWRSWAAEELADLETAVSGPVIETKHNPNNPFARKAERRASAKLSEAERSGARIAEGLERPKLLGTQSDSMNERFPMLPMRPNRSSPAPSRKTSSISKTSIRMKDDDDDGINQIHHTNSLGAEHAAVPKKRSNLALHVTSASDVTPAIPPRPRRNKEGRAARLARRGMQLKEQPSLAGLLAEEQTREAERALPSGRKPQVPAPVDENFLLRIRKGPYSAAGGSSSPARSSHNGSVDSFDLLSRKRGTGIGGLVKGVKLGSHDENARPSPTKGQFMVDDFLGKRMSRGWRETAEVDDGAGQGSSPRFL